eukprot:scaffold91449_cov15-Tisochrysis_lutea.AAC.1
MGSRASQRPQAIRGWKGGGCIPATANRGGATRKQPRGIKTGTAISKEDSKEKARCCSQQGEMMHHSPSARFDCGTSPSNIPVKACGLLEYTSKCSCFYLKHC